MDRAKTTSSGRFTVRITSFDTGPVNSIADVVKELRELSEILLEAAEAAADLAVETAAIAKRVQE